MKKLTLEQKWDIIDKIVRKTVSYGIYQHTIKDAIGELAVKPLTGIPIAIAVLYGFWSLFTSISSFITDGFMVKIFDGYWLPWLQKNFPGKPGDWLYSLMVDVGHKENGILVNSDNCLEAFGVLTSGLFVSIGIVLPAIFVFYLIITILEDSGYLPRLAVLLDNIMHKIGLHGYAIIPTILGFGCNVPAVHATRILETKKQRILMMTLVSIFIPCGSQLSVMQNVIPEYTGVIVLYLLFGYFTFGYILNKIIPGKSPEMLIDIPELMVPSLRNVSKKLWIRMSSFLISGIPLVMLGSLLVGVLYLSGVIDFLGKLLEPIFTIWFGVPKETSAPLIAAFLRKDLAVAQLKGLADAGIIKNIYQMVSSVVLVSLYFPCLATFIMILKESGRDFIKIILALFVAVFIYGGLLHLIWILMGVG
ncbi:MAG: hypothetical protein DRN18_03085 [Thermoplasmata archaeon]|nr:MAG: hypothetical protein DRN18_03085 [Thermoplasmata archaeon]